MRFKNKFKIFLLFCSIIFIVSCDNEMLVNLERIEVIEQPSLQYVAGKEISSFRLTGGKIKAYFDDDNVIERSIEQAWVGNLDFEKGKAIITYQEKTAEINIPSLTYIQNDEELKATVEEEKNIYVIKGGSYNVVSLKYNRPVVLIGLGEVVINFTGHALEEAAMVCQESTSLYNLTINYIEEKSHFFALRLGQLEKENNITLTEKVYIEKVIINGGKGLGISGINEIVCLESEINIEPSTKNVALTIFAGTNMKLIKTKVTQGTWGSIAILGVDALSPIEWNKRKSTLRIENCEISSAVYIEHYEVTSSEIFGLEDWKVVEQNQTKVYLRQEQ